MTMKFYSISGKKEEKGRGHDQGEDAPYLLALETGDSPGAKDSRVPKQMTSTL